MTDDKLKLHYFNTRGRAELIRYIFKAAGRNFEDIRYTKEDWPNHKSKFPTGQLPVLEFEQEGEHHILTQSLTIARSAARYEKLAGANGREEAQCDEVVDCLNELTNLVVLAYYDQDNEHKEKIKNRLMSEECPRLLGYLEKKLHANGGKHIVGSSWTWADFAVSLFMHGLRERADVAERVDFDNKLPGLVALAKSVEEIPAIAEWIKIRPQT